MRKPERKKLAIPKCKWDHYIKIDLQEGGWRACTGLIWLEIKTDGEHVLD
jgi:hypothetical protein